MVYCVVYYRMFEYVCESPDGYRPKMPQVPVGDAIRTSARGGFCENYCGLGHVGDDWGWAVGVGSLSALCSVVGNFAVGHLALGTLFRERIRFQDVFP